MFTVCPSLQCAGLGIQFPLSLPSRTSPGSRAAHLRWSPTGHRVGFLLSCKCMWRGSEGIFLLIDWVIWCSWCPWRHLAELTPPAHPPRLGHGTPGNTKPLELELQIQTLCLSQVPWLIPCLGPACWALVPCRAPGLCRSEPWTPPQLVQSFPVQLSSARETAQIRARRQRHQKVFACNHTIALFNNEPPEVKALYRRKSNN